MSSRCSPTLSALGRRSAGTGQLGESASVASATRSAPARPPAGCSARPQAGLVIVGVAARHRAGALRRLSARTATASWRSSTRTRRGGRRSASCASRRRPVGRDGARDRRHHRGAGVPAAAEQAGLTRRGCRQCGRAHFAPTQIRADAACLNRRPARRPESWGSSWRAEGMLTRARSLRCARDAFGRNDVRLAEVVVCHRGEFAVIGPESATAISSARYNDRQLSP